MFRTKICGVTRIEDAIAVAEAGADAIGLNFYERSSRCVSLTHAGELAGAVQGGPLVVGVFVNAAAEAIARAIEAAGLDMVQLHGDEPPELAAELPVGTPILRAIRRDPPSGLQPGVAWMEASAAAGRPIAGLLVDAAAPAGPGGETVYGGTGQTTDWASVAVERAALGPVPLLLAGGLTPMNVAEAIARTGADGVDTASGVESAPGLKDPGLVRDFVARSHAAIGQRPA